MRLRLAVAGLLLCLGGLITVPFLAIGTVAPRSVAAPTAPHPRVMRCTDSTPSTPHFYFFDKEKESSGAFGPSADKGSDSAVKQELVRRLCGDKHTGQDLILVEVMDRLRAVTAPSTQPSPGDPSSPPDIADDLVKNAIDWRRTTVVTTTAPEGATTLYMRKTARELSPTMVGVKLPQVLVTPISEAHRHSRYLVLYFNGSDIPVLLRLPCGFQPVFTDGKVAWKVAD